MLHKFELHIAIHTHIASGYAAPNKQFSLNRYDFQLLCKLLSVWMPL